MYTRTDGLDDVTLKNISVQLTIRGSGKHKQTITKLLALPGGIKLTFSGTVGVTLCRRNCHVDPHKIDTCFRTFPKFKLTNAPHFYLMQNRRRIRAGYSPNSFFEAIVGA